MKVQENVKTKNLLIRDITKEQNVYRYKETNNKAYLYWYLPHWYGLHLYKPNIGMNKLIVLIVNMLLKYIYRKFKKKSAWRKYRQIYKTLWKLQNLNLMFRTNSKNQGEIFIKVAVFHLIACLYIVAHFLKNKKGAKERLVQIDKSL